MITTAIGRILLNAYNEREGTKYDAREFFVEVFYPLFFKSSKYLMWVQNSPFVQGFKAEKWDEEDGSLRLEQFLKKIDAGCKDASVALGYSASEEKEFATTSGQVSSMTIKINQDDCILSWIGAALGVGVAGGISILFSNKNILLDILDGWKIYRSLLNERPELKGNQCASWNAQWLSHRYSKLYDENKVMSNFDPFETSGGETKVKMQTWTKVLIGISQKYKESRQMAFV